VTKGIAEIVASKIGILAIVSALLIFGCHRTPSFPEPLFEEPAMAATDFEKLDPAIRKFISLAKAGKVIGRPASEFTAVLKQMTIPSDEQSDPPPRVDAYQLWLPMNEQAQKNFDAAIKTPGTVPCWPMLFVRVDTETTLVLRVAVYWQCL
jgi:hypothetical protein